MIQRILVPVDGSAGSAAAAQTARSVAIACRAAIDFLYVANLSGAIGEYPLGARAVFPNSILECVVENGKKIIGEALDRSPDGLETAGHCVSGEPTKAILSAARDWHSDLIVMGSRGLGAVKGFLLGSVSRFLMENAACPVMVVKTNAFEEKLEGLNMMEIKRILVPVDGSETSDRAIEQATDLARACGAKLDFLYVANINQLAINACLSDAILEAVTKAGNVILDRALEKVPQDVTAEGFSETGSPAVVILDFANAEGVDLIVMGSRGLGVVKGVLLGSVSQHLVEQAKCPVMVVK